MFKLITFLSILLIAFIQPALANVGIPMLTYEYPLFILTLPIVIIIEARAYKKRLHINFRQAAQESMIANLVSTFIGIPITWGVLVGLQLMVGGGGFIFPIDNIYGKILNVTVQGPWLLPHGNELNWMIPAAGIFLLIPFFFMSWWIEALVFIRRIKKRKVVPNIEAALLKSAAFKANLQSYIFLFLCLIGIGIYFNYFYTS